MEYCRRSISIIYFFTVGRPSWTTEEIIGEAGFITIRGNLWGYVEDTERDINSCDDSKEEVEQYSRADTERGLDGVE